jgi:hypothetical protein
MKQTMLINLKINLETYRVYDRESKSLDSPSN